MNDLLYRYPEEKPLVEAKYANHKKLFSRDVLNGVLTIFDEVGSDGDEGIRRLTKQFDGVELGELVLPDEYVTACIASIEPALRDAIDGLIRSVEAVNAEMMPASWQKEIRPGTIIGETVTPLDSVGIWIPARKGPLLSTAIMLVVAARVAGVRRIVVGMPPLADGLGDPGTVAAARLAGADKFVVGNGVSVIAAFAQGSNSIPEVDGVFGPGPGGIAAAMSVAMTFGKKSVLGIGPTESVILADESADPITLAYDLMNEAEHGPDSACILVTTSHELALSVQTHLFTCIAEVEPNRQRILRSVFGGEGKGAIIVAPDLEEACAFINWFAPEHLMLICGKEQEARALELIAHAGEILLGPDTPFSAANYAIGITAVLPTNQFAKAYSGITAKEMVKVSTIGKLDRDALNELFPIIEQLGTYEQLPCHVKAAAVRLTGRD